MASEEHLELLRQGVDAWNTWREKEPLVRPDLSGAEFRRANLQRANLAGANLRKADLLLANLIAANLTGADLCEACLFAVNLAGANLSVANLSSASFAGANLRRAILIGADLREAHLGEGFCNTEGFFDEELRGAHLTRANLSGANLSGAYLSGATFHNEPTEANSGADLSGANLGGANLGGANLRGVHLSGANLSGANLREANLAGQYLAGDNLSGANLRGANLRGADLSGANLEADLSEADLSEAYLSGADLSGGNLSRATLVRTNLENSKLTRCTVYGTSAWGLTLSEGTKQQNMIITPDHEPQVTVDNIEVAQFIYLMLHNEKIRDAIDTIGKKGVLLLGRFTEGRIEVLERLREELRKRDLMPMVFNFDKPETKGFTETVRLLAGLSRFVIADITNPRSAPLELQATVPEYMIPFVPIIERGEEPFSMFKDLWIKHREWVLDPIRYRSVDRLIEVLDAEIIGPANDRYNQLLARKAEQLRIKDV